MAFNSNTYFANKYRRAAWDELKRARDLKARIVAGDAFDWERDVSFPQAVRNARANMHRHLFYLEMKRLEGRHA